jgi:uncharacterized protein YndB with AHSA1/START domain
MSTPETTAAVEVRLERTFDAPAEAVFDAWTNPEVLRRWWVASPNGTTPLAEVDLKVGGRYRMAMINEEGGETVTVGGEYVEVDRPRRLAYTWTWEGSRESGSENSLVTLEFEEHDGRTTVTLVHTGITSQESRDSHAQGWAGCFDNLGRRIFGAAAA